LSLALFALGAAPAAAQDSARTELVFLDVGQGDAVLIRSPEGRTALIDAGPGSIVSMLLGLGVDTIDLAIASHPHVDHIGGMEEVLRTFPVRYYLDNGVPHTTGTYRSLMRWVEQSGVTYLEASARTLSLGSVNLRILPPPATARSLNDQSVGVIVEFGAFKAILTGDSEWAELEHIRTLGVPEVSVLKAAHHGSYNGVNPAWLAATRPEVVVISCGSRNPYGHPHAQALHLYQATAAVYRTDVHGTVRQLGSLRCRRRYRRTRPTARAPWRSLPTASAAG
ncbi:MAG: MBL fold metallo-hydrolase, partial [Gemmatimonadetes bacterium]|nr:MBL fold metallo-hydrolase [Gemmatimonadota bacterium]